MPQAVNSQLILAVAIVLLTAGIAGWLVYTKIAAVAALRHDFDKRAPWMALGVIIAGVIIYYRTRH
jgi:archaellum component FlaG (FlaF/FlaG flagellin family)